MKIVARLSPSNGLQMIQFLDKPSRNEPSRPPLRPPVHPGDVGYDLQCPKGASIAPMSFGTIPTGVHIDACPPVWYQVRPRSSFTKRGAIVPQNTIDAEYQGELVIPVFNLASYYLIIKPGEYIAQIVFFLAVHPDLQEVAEFQQKTVRGEAGFGSTGA